VRALSGGHDQELDEVLHALAEEAADVQLSAEDRAHVIGGRYEVVDKLGAGGMGQVFLVRHQRLGKPFALKLMHAEFSLRAEAEEIFRREAQLASHLSHPNIVEVVDFGYDPDWGWFIVMEYLQGETLGHHIARHGYLPIAVACDVAIQLVDAVKHSHKKGVVHADLKSDNVLCLVPDGDEDRRHWQVKLFDFGTAQIASLTAGSVDRITGTPEYIAPERVAGGPLQPSIDIYAVGIIIYEMLAGAPPFTGEPAAVLERQLVEAPEPAGARRGEVLDARLDAILEKALAKDPAQRYPSADAMLADLRAYMDVLGVQRRAGLFPAAGASVAEERVAAAAAGFDALAFPVAGLRRDGTIVVANHAFARLLTSDVNAIVGRNAHETFLDDLNPELHEDLRAVALNGKVVRRDLAIDRGERHTTLRYVLAPASGACGHCLLILHRV
jgi:PAS domain-containing protein